MNPNAEPFNPTTLLIVDVKSPPTAVVVSSSNADGKQKHSRRERMRRRQQQRLVSVSTVIKSPIIEIESHKKNEHEQEQSSMASKQAAANHSKKQRRRHRRNNHKSKDTINGESSTEHTDNRNDHRLKSEANSSASKPFAMKHRTRTRGRGQKDTVATRKSGSSLLKHNEIQAEDNASFPLLSTAASKSHGSTVTRAEGFWSNCLNNLLLVEEQSLAVPERVHVKDIQSTFHNDSSLTLLKPNLQRSNGTTKDDNDQPKLDASNEAQQCQINESPELLVDTNSSTSTKTPLLPNVKVKWNETQMSRMRIRWWEAQRIKRQMEIETKKKEKELLMQNVDSADESSSASSSTSSSDDSMQPPSLKNPFDEVTIKCGTSQQMTLLEESSVSPQITLLEKKCLQSDYPLHFIIHHYYSLRQHQQHISDAKTVLIRLLEKQDIATVELWRSTTMSLYNLNVFEILLDLNVLPGIQLLSADLEALTPLQLAIILDLPEVVCLLLSTICPSLQIGAGNKPTTMEEDEFGRTPLMLSCELHRQKCIEALLSLIVKPKLDHRENNGGNSAFHLCCMRKQMMFSGETSTNTVPLSAAADTIELLLSRTPPQLQKRILFSVNNSRQSLLHLACASADLSLVECILSQLNQRGCNFVMKALNMKDRKDCVPFICAIKANA